MSDIVDEQLAIEAAFAAVIASMEASLSEDGDGTLSLAVSDASEIEADPDVFQQLVDSLGETNRHVTEGELALSNVSLTTPEVIVG